MLKYFLIIWIIIFILIHLYLTFNKGPKKDEHFIPRLMIGYFMLSGILLSIYLLFVISLSFVILFDLSYKFGNIGFIIGLLIFIPIYFLSWKNRKDIEYLATKYISSIL
jgi:tryptophan-rich sensory protein